MDNIPFNILLKRNLPHILEEIFFNLDYDSFKNCMEVCGTWRGLLQSPKYMKRAKSVFWWKIKNDGIDLCNASRVGNIERVKRIVSCKMVNVDFICKYKGTPLCEAALSGDRNVVQLLLNNGADPNKVDGFEWTPLHHATYRGNRNVVEVLLERGSDPDSSTINGSTPLHLALKYGDEEMVKLLLQKGASPKKQNYWGGTPIHLAQERGFKKVVRMLQGDQLEG